MDQCFKCIFLPFLLRIRNRKNFEASDVSCKKLTRWARLAQQHSGNVRGFLLHCFQRCEFDPRDVEQLLGTLFSKVSLR